jgi:hypothetical protein
MSPWRCGDLFFSKPILNEGTKILHVAFLLFSTRNRWIFRHFLNTFDNSYEWRLARMKASTWIPVFPFLLCSQFHFWNEITKQLTQFSSTYSNKSKRPTIQDRARQKLNVGLLCILNSYLHWSPVDMCNENFYSFRIKKCSTPTPTPNKFSSKFFF